MKKVIAFLSGIFAPLLLAVPAYAGSFTPCPTGQFGSVCQISASSFSSVVSTVVNILFIVAVIVALFYLIWGGIKWITSGGDKAKVESARSTIIAGIIGLILVFLAYFILTLVASLFNINLNNISVPSI